MSAGSGPLADRGPVDEPRPRYYRPDPEASRPAPGGRHKGPASLRLAAMSAPSIDSFSSDVLTIEVDGHVATLWLDRPEKRNAMGPAFWADLPWPWPPSAPTRTSGPWCSRPGARTSRVGLDLTAHGRHRRRRTAPGPTVSDHRPAARAAPRQRSRSSASRHRSPRWPTAPSRSSPPSTATASAAGVDLIAACDIRLASADAAVLGAGGEGGHRGRPRQPAAAARHHRQGPRGRAGLHGQGHHRRTGRRPSDWSTT